MSEYYEYIAKDGDRWDTIANEFYGDPFLFDKIIGATHNYAASLYPPSVISAGTLVKIPVLEESEVTSSNLPPWKR